MNIRTATMEDLEEIAQVEKLCFPEAEAANKDALAKRLLYYPNHFWILEEEGKIISLVNGLVTDEYHLADQMYERADGHNEKGQWQMIFGVDTLPTYRRQGYATQLLRWVIGQAQKEGRLGLVLTCKDKLVPYYTTFGFVDEGISKSEHGGVIWHEMRLNFTTGHGCGV